jgi:Flp pilus assembly protein TadG
MSMKRQIRGARLRGEEGQSVVEFAIVMPFLVFLLLAICQFGLAMYNYISVTDAVRVGARKAAVSRTAPSTCQAAKDAIQATLSTDQWNNISGNITCTPATPGATGSSFTVSTSYPITIGLPPIFGLPAFNYTGNMPASATERLE